MLTPMMVQYLVGLCCLKHEPECVEIILGDMVFDAAAEKTRDVDITITFRDENGDVTAFKAAEVKDESKPLDVIKVEQLCQKFSDMPHVTHKSIFSTSGYTEAAKRKAKYHSVELYTMEPWVNRIEDDFPDFPDVGQANKFLRHFYTCLLYWMDDSLFLVVPDVPQTFQWVDETLLLCSNGNRHREFANMKQLRDYITKWSTGMLYTLEPARSMMTEIITSDQDSPYLAGTPWSHTHTIDIAGRNIFIKLNDTLHKIESLSITGKLQWIKKERQPEFFIVKNCFTSKVFAGAVIADYGENDGRMAAMIFSEYGREINVHQFCIPEKQMNIIRKIEIPNNL